ncbi:MAG TPA: zinc-binding dehydrogenase [Gammaproteobacteria bacterium]|nr:zinc-binding dehydrogenase [Gammaproteobacteria bacterium]
MFVVVSIATRPDLERVSTDVFRAVMHGVVSASVGQTYSLRNVALAHRDIEERRTRGSTILIP